MHQTKQELPIQGRGNPNVVQEGAEKVTMVEKVTSVVRVSIIVAIASAMSLAERKPDGALDEIPPVTRRIGWIEELAGERISEPEPKIEMKRKFDRSRRLRNYEVPSYLDLELEIRSKHEGCPYAAFQRGSPHNDACPDDRGIIGMLPMVPAFIAVLMLFALFEPVDPERYTVVGAGRQDLAGEVNSKGIADPENKRSSKRDGRVIIPFSMFVVARAVDGHTVNVYPEFDLCDNDDETVDSDGIGSIGSHSL
jgi:hypothetical protein